MSDTIRVVAASDANFAQHLGVMLCSLFENSVDPARLEVYIVDGGILSEDRAKLLALARRYGVDVGFVHGDTSRYGALKTIGPLTAATYYRYMIPELLPPSYDKALYLDSDMVVVADLAELWHTDLGDHYLAAVNEPLPPPRERLGLPADAPYFNAGVILLNLAAWRTMEVANAALAFARAHPDWVTYPSQDPLNVVSHGHWLALHPRWNLQSPMLWTYRWYQSGPVAPEVREATRKPAIVHFSATPKPWRYMNTNPYQYLYYKYLAKTAWRDYSPPDKTLRNAARKHLAMIRRRMRLAFERLGGRRR